MKVLMKEEENVAEAIALRVEEKDAARQALRSVVYPAPDKETEARAVRVDNLVI